MAKDKSTTKASIQKKPGSLTIPKFLPRVQRVPPNTPIQMDGKRPLGLTLTNLNQVPIPVEIQISSAYGGAYQVYQYVLPANTTSDFSLTIYIDIDFGPAMPGQNYYNTILYNRSPDNTKYISAVWSDDLIDIF